jgi:hypothetical protein
VNFRPGHRLPIPDRMTNIKLPAQERIDATV